MLLMVFKSRAPDVIVPIDTAQAQTRRRAPPPEKIQVDEVVDRPLPKKAMGDRPPPKKKSQLASTIAPVAKKSIGLADPLATNEKTAICRNRFPDVDYEALLSQVKHVALYGSSFCPCSGVALDRFASVGLCLHAESSHKKGPYEFLQCVYGQSYHSFVFVDGEFVGSGFAFATPEQQQYSKQARFPTKQDLTDLLSRVDKAEYTCSRLELQGDPSKPSSDMS